MVVIIRITSPPKKAPRRRRKLRRHGAQILGWLRHRGRRDDRRKKRPRDDAVLRQIVLRAVLGMVIVLVGWVSRTLVLRVGLLLGIVVVRRVLVDAVRGCIVCGGSAGGDSWGWSCRV